MILPARRLTPATRFLSLADSHLRLPLFEENHRLLQALGIYESALLRALTSTKTNTHGWPPNVLEAFVRQAHPARLRAAGAPLPQPPPDVLYRGIAGCGRARWLRGLSWTGSLQVACWFALSRRLPAPAVRCIPFEASTVLAHVHARGEDEYLVLLPPQSCPERVRMDRAKMQAHADQHQAALQARTERLLARRPPQGENGQDA
jgi:hypothetical protein